MTTKSTHRVDGRAVRKKWEKKGKEKKKKRIITVYIGMYLPFYRVQQQQKKKKKDGVGGGGDCVCVWGG